MNNIPSAEDFARAKKRMRELDRNIDQVNKNVRQYFKEICPNQNYDFHLLAEEILKFRVYVFYKSEKDIQENEDIGVAKKLETYIYEELERQGRGNKRDIAVEFEFDSDENVQAQFAGDYFIRMR